MLASNPSQHLKSDSRRVTFKKSLRASEQDRPDVARRRERWKARQATIDPRRLVFIDETWAKTNMTRTHGRCPRGERLVAKTPFGRWRTLTFLAALRCDRLTAPCVIDGQKRFTSVLADPPGGQNRFSPLARTQPLGDAVDEQVGDRVLGEIALAEVFVLGPQLLGDLAHRRPRQKPPVGLVGEGVLDVARRQAPRVEFDRKPFEFPRAPRKRRPHVRHEWLRRVPDLRSRIVHSALRCLDLARSITVAIASFAVLAALVTFPR